MIISVKPVNFNSFLRMESFLGYKIMIAAIIKGSKRTIELTFTPSESPREIEAITKYKILFCLTNFSIKSKELNRKKIWADSGVAKWACWISPGVIATKKAAIRVNCFLVKKVAQIL